MGGCIDISFIAALFINLDTLLVLVFEVFLSNFGTESTEILDFFPECATKQFRMNLDTYLVFAEDESECMCKKKPRQLRIKEEKVEEKLPKNSIH